VTFNPNLPIKKAKKDIESYLKNGPKFGKILKQLYEGIESKELIDSDSVNREYRNLIVKEFYPNGITPIRHEIFPFVDQKNSYNEPFQNEICVSVNECIAHGYYKKKFSEGDVISIDCGFTDTNYKDGKRLVKLNYDSAFTIRLSEEQEWVTAPLKALQEIVIRNPKTTIELGTVIEEVAESMDVKTVVSLTGHGIGYNLHEAPFIYNARGKYQEEELFDGLCFCAEPIFSPKNISSIRDTRITKSYIDSDGWSVYTRDGSYTSHFETMFCVIKGQIVDLTGITKWLI
jgi:methionyl aminopeptidase